MHMPIQRASSWRLVSVAATFLVNAAATGVAQTIPASVVLEARQTCVSCGIEISKRLTLRAPVDGTDLTHSFLLQDGSGRYITTDAERTSLLVFDRNGKLIGKGGRPGDGPGELRAITAAATGPGDSIWVVDRTNRLTVFGPDLRVSRSGRLPHRVHDILPMPGGRVAIAAAIGTAGAAGYAIHLLNQRLEYAGSLGYEAEPTLDPRCSACADQRMFSGPSPGVLWIADANRYSFALWGIQGRTAIRGYRVARSDWFVPWNRSSRALSGEERVDSRILRVAVDAKSRIWVSGIHAPPDWKPHPPTPASGIRVTAEGAITGDFSKLDEWLTQNEMRDYETVIEVFDPVSAVSVASTRVPGNLRLINATTAYRLAEDVNGLTVIEVYDVRLRAK
jgi:hypothetical protein